MSFGSGPIKVVEKLWGTERWYVNEPEYCMKLMIVKPGYACSLHYHLIKKETFILTQGNLLIEINGDPYTMRDGDSCTLTPNTTHRFYNYGPEDAQFIEISTHHDDADVVRLEPSQAL